MSNVVPFLITMGDAAGIGPEIIAKAFADAPSDTAGCVVVGDVAVLRRAAALVASVRPGQLPLSVAELTHPGDAYALPPRCIGVWPAGNLPAPPAYGQISADSGRAAGDRAG